MVAPAALHQSGQPAGRAIREGDWKFVEHYDDDEVQLFNLANDVTSHATSPPPSPLARQRLGKLRAWRKSIDAQENRPNPAVNLSIYNALYVSFDPTRFDPPRAAMRNGRTWRSGANS